MEDKFFGIILRNHRRSMHISTDELCKKARIRREVLHGMEHMEVPPIIDERLKILCQLLSMNYDIIRPIAEYERSLWFADRNIQPRDRTAWDERDQRGITVEERLRIKLFVKLWAALEPKYRGYRFKPNAKPDGHTYEGMAVTPESYAGDNAIYRFWEAIGRSAIVTIDKSRSLDAIKADIMEQRRKEEEQEDEGAY